MGYLELRRPMYPKLSISFQFIHIEYIIMTRLALIHALGHGGAQFFIDSANSKARAVQEFLCVTKEISNLQRMEEAAGGGHRTITNL